MINDNWVKTIIPLNSTINEAINVLNDTALRIVLITDEKNVLIGSITDGDIRRGLLRGLTIDSSIKEIINRNTLVVSPELKQVEIVQLMTANRIQQIPIVNDQNQVVGLHLWDELSKIKSRSNIMIIMAGGKGTRLQPQTLNCPKPLLPLNGKPILEHIISRAKADGFNHFILAIHYLGQMIEDHFGSGEKLGVKIEYLREDTPLGTAGALSLLGFKPKESFIVTNGDVITDIDYAQLMNFHIENNSTATMAVRNYFWQNPFGVIQTQGVEVIDFVEKPITQSLINAGIYVLEPSALELLENSTYCDMPTLVMRLRSKFEKVIAFPIHENWTDIGQPKDLVEEILRQKT